jgi:hypothetical protein
LGRPSFFFDSLTIFLIEGSMGNSSGTFPVSFFMVARTPLPMRKPIAKNSKTSLSGSLASYVREHKIFTRPAPNTFGLVEFAEVAIKEPPEGFGELASA